MLKGPVTVRDSFALLERYQYHVFNYISDIRSFDGIDQA